MQFRENKWENVSAKNFLPNLLLSSWPFDHQGMLVGLMYIKDYDHTIPRFITMPFLSQTTKFLRINNIRLGAFLFFLSDISSSRFLSHQNLVLTEQRAHGPSSAIFKVKGQGRGCRYSKVRPLTNAYHIFPNITLFQSVSTLYLWNARILRRNPHILMLQYFFLILTESSLFC